MNMKDHILAALNDEFNSWEEFLVGLREEQINVPRFDLGWTIKDVLAHLWAWQQISIARMEAGLQNQEPNFPKWIVESIENWEEDADQVNALTYEKFHDKSWAEIYQNWRNGFRQLLDLGAEFPERDLLDGDKYHWLHGYSLAAYLIASYDHHQEHFEKLKEWLEGRN